MSTPDISTPRIITLLIQHAPHEGSRARAALDMALSAAVFEQQVHVIFLADGVFQLLANQQSQGILAKNTSAALGALSLYGIDTVYVDEQALIARHLSDAQFCCEFTAVDERTIRQMIHASDVVMSL